MDMYEAKNQLKIWREENYRHSDEVVDIWLDCLEPYKNKLGDEKWMVLEQVLVAALDTHQMDVVDECYIELSKQFPGSRRVLRLKAMRLEALERFDDAVAIYDAIIKEDETNSMARKRKMAILKEQGRIADAIKELTEYVKKFMSDTEAWQELCDLYLKEGDYAKASFCMEELMLTSPLNHLYCTRYAEIKYTQGGQENIDIARSYFCQAIKQNPNYVRAYYGILVTCSNAGMKLSSVRRKELQKLAQFAQKKIVQQYKGAKVDGEKMKLLSETFNALST